MRLFNRCRECDVRIPWRKRAYFGSVLMPRELANRLRAAAKANDRSMAAEGRVAVEEHLAKEASA